jgi:hypothetical protein
MKEYCILVVILAATLAHAQQVGMAEGKFMIPTIAVPWRGCAGECQKTTRILWLKEKLTKSLLIKKRPFEGNHPLLGGEERNQPMIGGDENMPIVGR